jgi:hypothetical protein
MLDPNFQYHPLDGVELLKWILQDSGQKLREYSDFARHRSYHNPRYTLSLVVETYDATGKYASSEQKIQSAGEKYTVRPDPEGDRATLSPPTISEGPLLTPDNARDMIREGKYQTKKVGDVLCDVKETTNWSDIGKKNPNADPAHPKVEFQLPKSK